MNSDSFTESSTRTDIRFVLDGEVKRIANVDPTRTVLQYLREDLGRLGTKEGCAEGDCGACTIVLLEIDSSGDRLQVRAINSCIQFLPTLDGKEVVTVESLRDGDGRLHPVQQAMVDCHASQCGFCTPGFVMSLFALYKNNSVPTRRDIDDALAGNLCRCTGYRPIIDAVKTMYDLAADEPATRLADTWMLQPNGDSKSGVDAERQKIRLLQSLRSDLPLSTIAAGKVFHSPENSDDLAQLLLEYPAATLLAGGTDVGLWVTKQHRDLDVIIYTGRVEELNRLDVGQSAIEIGAAVALTDVMPVLIDRFPAFDELLRRFASPPIRNAGTLGGNIANGSPIGDSMPLLLVLDASLVLRYGDQKRQVPLNEFYTAYQQSILQQSEFIETIILPLPQQSEYVESYKVSKRFDQDISALCGAFRLQLDDNKVTSIRIAYGGMAETPKRAVSTEQALLGKEWTSDTVRSASESLTGDDYKAISDMRSTAEYRQRVCRNLLRRFYLETTGNQSSRVYEYGR